MKIKNIHGREISFSPVRYIVKWGTYRGSKFQTEIKKFFQTYWKNDLVAEEMIIPGSRLRIDLINFTKKIVVESSGDQHVKYSKFMHGSRSGFHASIQRDVKKLQWCENNGFAFIEIMYDEVNLVSREWIKEKFDVEIY